MMEWVAIGGVAMMVIAWLAKAWGESEREADELADDAEAMERAKRARQEVENNDAKRQAIRNRFDRRNQ